MQVAEIFNTMSYGPAPESTESVDAWLETNRDGFGFFINGGWVASAEILDSVNPANGKSLAKIAVAGSGDVDAAVKAARAAQPAWEKLGGHGRARYLYALAQLLQKRAREFAVLESLDSGKPICETGHFDIPLAIDHFHHHAGWAQVFEAEFPGRCARGVAGLIISPDFPLLMAAQKIAPALAAGNCIVLKPSEHTSVTALMFASLCEEIGLPPGVVNIVTGGGATGEYLVDHPEVDQLHFAGSAAVCGEIRKRTAGSGKALTLDLAGRLPFIIFDDADLDSAVEGLVDAIGCNQGQSARNSSQLLVQEGVEARVAEKIHARIQKLRVGEPLDNNTDTSTVIGPDRMERIAERTDAVADDDLLRPAFNVTSFRLLSEAVALANSGGHVAAASVWSENISRALDVASQLKAATVWMNSCHPRDMGCGFGREAGREAVENTLRPAFEFSRGEMAIETIHTARSTTTVSSAGLPPIVSTDGEHLRDIPGAVSAAVCAGGWARNNGFSRGRILYRMAENLSARAEEFCWRLAQSTAVSEEAARREVDVSLKRLFTYAAWADKYEGAVRPYARPGAALTVNEAVGVIGIGCPDHLPLLAPVSLLAPALAMGNRVVLVLSESNAQAASDYHRLLEELFEGSGMPTGVVNIVTGARDELVQILAAHKQVDGVWYFGSAEGSKRVEQASALVLNRIWVNRGKFPDWFSRDDGEGRHFLREACRVKNVWIP